MYSLRKKRCIASLLLLVMLLTFVAPITAYAENTTYTLNELGTYVMKQIDNYYPAGPTPEASQSGSFIHFTGLKTGDKEEIIQWGITKKLGDDAPFKFDASWKSDKWLQKNMFGKFIDIEVGEFPDLMEKLSNASIGSTQGASGSADESNLCHRMSAFMFSRIMPSVINSYSGLSDDKIDANYADMLTQTLELGHKISLEDRFKTIGFVPETGGDDEVGLVNDITNYYSARYLGALALAPDDNDFHAPTYQKAMQGANTYAAYICLIEFTDYYVSWMKNIVNKDGWEKDEDVKKSLTVVKGFNDAFGTLIPAVTMIYEQNNLEAKDKNDVTYSLKDMVDTVGIEDVTSEEATVTADDSYQVNRDESTPIGDFYILNAKTGILSYDRDKILGDVLVNKGLDETLKEERDQQIHDNVTNMLDNYVSENKLNDKDAAALTEALYATQKATDYIKDSVQVLNPVKDKETYDVDESGRSAGAGSVTIADNIIEGMSYSTTYIPMHTNMYSPDTIAQFDEKFRDEFFYKYGFLRKALYKDDNGDAAVAYYTAGGKFTGTKSVCTLRDMIESGDNDLVLYVDSSLYNASKAVEWGNTKLEAQLEQREELCSALSKYAEIWQSVDSDDISVSYLTNVMGSQGSPFGMSLVSPLSVKKRLNGEEYVDFMIYKQNFADKMKKVFDFDMARFSSAEDIIAFVENQSVANKLSSQTQLSDKTLKTGDYDSYDNSVRKALSAINDTDYLNLDSKQGVTFDSPDSLLLPSSDIKEYMSLETNYSEEHKDENGNLEYTNEYTATDNYSEALPLAWVSCLYRNGDLYSLANTVEHDNPVFMASDDLCGIEEANQWYRNSLLNYMLLRNLKDNVQVDYNYVVDLDCPVYMDIFGNILTESGTVVIPAASNATLHTGAYKNYNVSVGLYSTYGKAYSVPLDLKGAYSVIAPYFIADKNSDKYIINSIKLEVNGHRMQFDKTNQYDVEVQQAVMDIYKNCVVEEEFTNLNWMAMVKIINEVMRGAPIEAINKDEDALYSDVVRNRSAAIAAVKLESLIKSLDGKMKNTLMCIPDFTKVDGIEYFVAIAIKLIMVATAAVVIVFIYRDGVSGTLGLKTFTSSMFAIVLTLMCLTVVPAVFQLTYYGANKVLLHDEAMRILIVNTEKRSSGVEIGMTDAHEVESDDEFALQLDWINVPWYEQLDDILFKSTLDNLQKTKLKAYKESEAYNTPDLEIYNDGVYISTDELFDSVSIDYAFGGTVDGTKGLFLRGNNSNQTASFYTPYYVFLRTLVGNINEYNVYRSNDYDVEDKSAVENTMFTTKYMSDNSLKTVGVCYNYFTSPEFMGVDEEFSTEIAITSEDGKDDKQKTTKKFTQVHATGDFDIMRLYQIYGLTDKAEEDSPVQRFITNKERLTTRSLLFNDTHRSQFKSSLWYNDDFVFDEWELQPVTDEKLQKMYDDRSAQNLEAKIEQFDKRVEAMDSYARDFVAKNKDMLTKVTDETFIKVMALNMAIKYNQLFGVNSANALEIYNLDSNDLLRLCIVKSDEAAVACPMSYSRYVYNFGGEPSVYAAAILTMIMWLGSFIKPACTVIVFISVFVSVWVFRVVLRRPSANLTGYLVTVVLLCCTNILHSLLLKVSINLPDMGLSTLGCLMFLIFGQMAYLLVLSYVTGVSLKDWSNLGMTEYAKEAELIKSKFKKNDTSATLSGRVKHHDNNWDYYDDLVKQHRKRNVT